MPNVKYVRPYLYPAQFKAIYCDERYSWIEASTKSGKTHGCIVWLTEQALRGKRGHNFWWVAPIYAQAKIAYTRLCNAIPSQLYGKNDTELAITLFNGAKIWFKSGDKPDSLYGEDVYAAVIDEASRVKADSWFAVRSTLTATQGPIRIIGNVKGKRNWAFRGARRAEQGLENHRFSRLSAYDAVDGGVIPLEEVLDAQKTLPASTFRELYLALPADEGDAFFNTDRISVVEEAPKHVRMCRAWDLASTEAKPGKDPDWSVGALLGHTDEHTYVVDIQRFRKAPDGVMRSIVECAIADGPNCLIGIEQEPGSSGKIAFEAISEKIRAVSGTGRVIPIPVSGNKETRAFNLATRVNDGKVSLVTGSWNDEFLAELDVFPPEVEHDDQVDAASHAYNLLAPNRKTRLRFL